MALKSVEQAAAMQELNWRHVKDSPPKKGKGAQKRKFAAILVTIILRKIMFHYFVGDKRKARALVG